MPGIALADEKAQWATRLQVPLSGLESPGGCAPTLSERAEVSPRDPASICPLLPPLPGRVGLRAGSTRDPTNEMCRGSVLPCVLPREGPVSAAEAAEPWVPAEPGV